ncbi:MAG: 4Fe-4S cluster-binding domain-containing protein [Bacteroidales bacterium]|nr:4Fe-4S cluster-binding domain-containing protein [Bacteroidales bacterium]MBN2819541.1 4Fe-4S cluster-binding domain-containing protein [Bacteroidales bacterium]
MLKLTGITWITTYNCNLSCNHCFFETKGEKKYMNPDMIDLVLKDFPYDKHMFWQHLSGGEIFIDQKKLKEILKRIRKYFQKNIGLSTNAYWATEIKKTEQTVSELQKIGVTGIAVSADYYHQQQMPETGPGNLVKVISQSSLKTHTYIMGARLAEGIQGAEKINKETELITNRVDGGAGFPVASATERSIGKGSAINIPKKRKIPQGKCTELNTCLGERSPFNPAMVWIDPYGNVMICYGIVIGNVFQTPFREIVENYNVSAIPILEKLDKEGPKGLFSEALEQGLIVPEEFYDECDLCYQSRKYLRNLYPEVFKPDECYP